MDMYQEAAIFSEGQVRINSIQNASNLNHEINRATFCIPFEMNNSGKIIASKRTMKDLLTIISKTTKLKNLNNILIRYAYIDSTGTYSEGLCKTNKLPKGLDLIVFEIENESDKFKYLTHPLLVKT